MSSFRSYVSPWSKSTYGSSPSSSSSYLRGSGGGSTSLLSSSSASNKDDKPYGSTGTSYSRSRYGSSASDKSTGDGGDGSGSRDGGSTTSGYRSSSLTSSSPSATSRSPSATRTSTYRSPYSSSTLGSSSSGVGGSGAKDRSSSRDRLGYLSVTSPKGRVTSPEPEEPSPRSSSTSLASSYSSRPSSLRPLPTSRAGSIRSRYKDEADRSPTSPSTTSPGLLRSPRADVTPFKWTGRYTGTSSGLRSPGSEISPTVFGVSTPESKGENAKTAEGGAAKDDKTEDKEEEEGEDKKVEKAETISVVTRGTSPNPPTTYMRIRRYELAWQIQKEVPKPPKREMVDAEAQTDKIEEDSSSHSSRYSRHSSSSSRWSSYLDKYPGGSSSYVPRTYSRYGSHGSSASTPSPSVSKRPSPVRSSSGSISTSTNDSGAPENEKEAPSSMNASSTSSSASKPSETRSRDTKTAASEKTPSSTEGPKTESSKTESSEKSKTHPLKKPSPTTSEEPMTDPKSSQGSKSAKSSDETKSSPLKKPSPKTSEEPKTDPKSSEGSKSSMSSVETKSPPSPKTTSKSSDEPKTPPSKAESKSSEEPKIPAWKASLKTSTESKTSPSSNTSSKSSEESKSTQPKAETKSSNEPKTPSWKVSSKTSEESKSVSEVSKSLPSKSQSKSSEESQPTSVKTESKSSEVSKSPLRKASPKSSEDSKTSTTKTTSNTSEDSKSVPPKSSPSTEEKSGEKVELTENATYGSKKNLRSEESVYPVTTDRDKDTSSLASATTKPMPSSACSSTSSSPSRAGRERSPSAGRPTSRPPSVPASAPSSRGGSSERADTTSSSSRTSAGVKSLSSYSSSQDLSAPQKKLSSPRPPPSPRPLQRSSSATSLQGSVANKDFRKSALNMGEEPTPSETPEPHKRVVKKKMTRSRTLGSETMPPETQSTPQLLLPRSRKAETPPGEAKKAESVGIVAAEDEDEETTSAESVDEEEEREDEVSEMKSSGGGTAAKPPIPRKEGSVEDVSQLAASRAAKAARVRRRAEAGGSWREAYKAEENEVGADLVSESSKNQKSGKPVEVSSEERSSSSGMDKDRLKINKLRKQQSGERAWWMEGSNESPPEGVIIRVDSSKNLASDKSSEDVSKSSVSDKNKKKVYRISRQQTGEIAWWMEGSNESPPEGVISKVDSSKNSNSDKSSGDVSKSSVSDKNKKKVYRISRQQTGDMAWWLDKNQPVPEGIVKVPSSHSLTDKSSDDVSKKTESESSTDKKKPLKLIRQPSGEMAWWMDSSQPVPEGILVKVPSSHSLADKSSDDVSKKTESESSTDKKKPLKLIRQPSGEMAWWMDSSQPVPEGILVKVPSSHSLADKSSDDVSKKAGSESSTDKNKPLTLIRQPSGEITLWMEDSNEPLPDGIIRIESSSSLASRGSSEDINKKTGSDSASDKRRPLKLIKQLSGEKPWWMEGSDEPIPDGIIRIESSSSLASAGKSSEDQSKKSNSDKKKLIKITRQPSGEKAWWMEGSNEPIPEGVIMMESSQSLSSKPDSSVESSKSSRRKKGKLVPIWRQASGERAWWMEGSDAPVPDGIQKIESNSSLAGSQGDASKSSRAGSQEEGSGKSSGSASGAGGLRRRRLWRVESGERAWWLEGSDASVPEGIERIESTHSLASVGAEVAKKAVEAKKRASGASSSSESSSESSSSSEEEEEEEMPMEGSSESEEEEGEKRAEGEANGGIPRAALGTRTSPDGVEAAVGGESAASEGATAGGGAVPSKGEGEEEEEEDEEEEKRRQKERARRNLRFFIGRHTNIDDLLGSEVASPGDSVAAMVAAVEASQRSDGRGVKIKTYTGVGSEDESSSPLEEVDPSQVRIHDSTAQTPTLLQQQTITEGTGSEPAAGRPPPTPPPLPPGPKLDDAALQVYRDGDYGAYLDLEASISEQPEEFEGFQSNRKNSIVLRTQLSVRVHAVIEKLLNSEGRELRRALFSLKQIFQEDKDLVHEFVQNEGLACLIKVGSEADQNYQNYILRALGQVMLYVDGMNGVMAHNQTVQWLYSLIASRFRLVVKTALKLLLVFAEYVESNCLLLIRAVLTVDTAQGLPPWSNIMRLLKDYDTADTELLIYAMTLINRTLNGIPDQDTYYDQVDALEEQGMEAVVQRYMSKQGTDLDLLRQFQIYEAVLHHEDGEEKGAPLKQLDETIRKTLRNRKSLADSDSSERRKSRRHSTGTSPMSQSLSRQRHCNGHANLRLKPSYPGHQEVGGEGMGEGEEESSSGSSHSPSPPATGTPTSPLNNHLQFNSGGSNKGVSENVGVTPALRRRRERAERQRSFIREQQESGATLRASLGQADDGKSERVENGNAAISTNGHHDSSTPWSQRVHKEPNSNLESSGAEEGEGGERAAVRRIRRENTVRDLTQKLASQGGLLASPTEERVTRDIGDMSGIVSKAKEGLARSKSKADLRSPTDSSSSGRGGAPAEIKKSETELHWEELLSSSKRPLTLCDLDFTDLADDDDVDVLSPALPIHGGILPPPPPPCVPPPPAPRVPPAPPPVGGGFGRPPPPPPLGYTRTCYGAPSPVSPSPAIPKKSKKTVKLFWKEVREDPVALSKLSGGARNPSSATMIWDELQPVAIDTQKLEHLFESRAKDLIGKKQQELNKSKEIIVLDPKRSNAINIGMTKLPPPRSIKTAILKMDSTIVNREGIEKLLTMLPTEEERSRIQEAQSANPDVPLGSAEQFLLTLASISELSARLKLWAFKLDYENSEKEVAEPLMDLKQGMETLRASKTFRSILGTLLSVGIFLNGNEVKGFQIEYLAKVPEVKDTVHKHSLLHHLCHIVMEKFPDSSDLYSEIGAVTRASKVDFDELAISIQRMEQECKASWDHLKVIAKHDGSTMVKVKMSEFLADCAERIIVLGIVHRRVMNRFNKFLLWLGIPMHRVQDTKPNEFCKVVSEFALEYRTTRERVLQQLEKKASHRERNKTRGKMITDHLPYEVGKFRTKEDRADAELRQLLGSDFSEADSIHGTLPWRRQRKDAGNSRARGLTALLRGGDGNECHGDNMTDGDDEILESLVKTATKGPSTRTTPRERKRTRHADRKSLKRSRTRENNVCQFLAEAYNQ